PGFHCILLFDFSWELDVPFKFGNTSFMFDLECTGNISETAGARTGNDIAVPRPRSSGISNAVMLDNECSLATIGQNGRDALDDDISARLLGRLKQKPVADAVAAKFAVEGFSDSGPRNTRRFLYPVRFG